MDQDKNLPILDEIVPNSRKTEKDIRHTARIKYFPNKSEAREVEIMACSRDIFREPGWEVSNKWDTSTGTRARSARAASADEPSEAAENAPPDGGAGEDGAAAAAGGETSIARAARRARGKVRDLAKANKWDFFVTLTFAPLLIDRYDMTKITKTMNAWLSHQVERQGMKYVMVPERHKDGAIHFHGLIAWENPAAWKLEAEPSGTWIVPGSDKPRRPRSAYERAKWAGDPDTYHEVFNLRRYTLGFTTAIRLYGDQSRAVEYVCKYIGKQQGGEIEKPGGRWYYSGGKLQRPDVEFCDIGYREIEGVEGAYTFSVDAAAASFAKLTIRTDVQE